MNGLPRMRRYNAWLAAVVMGLMALPVAARQSSQEQTRESWQRVPDIFAALGARPGAVIADVGAGSGFFTERLARAVGPTGRIFAVDVDANTLEKLAGRVRDAGLSNVETIHSRHDDPRLPGASLDGALIVNAYHEMQDHQAMLAGIRASLKPDGRLVIVEPTSKSSSPDTREAQARRHQIAARFVQEDARAAGFRVVTFEEPFADRPAGDYEYLLVLAPSTGSAGSSGSFGFQGFYGYYELQEFHEFQGFIGFGPSTGSTGSWEDLIQTGRDPRNPWNPRNPKITMIPEWTTATS